jgi:hypothetical protein
VTHGGPPGVSVSSSPQPTVLIDLGFQKTLFSRTRGEETRGRETVVMPSKQTKRVKGSVGEGESDKQVKTIKHLGGQGTDSLTTITSVVKQTQVRD